MSEPTQQKSRKKFYINPHIQGHILSRCAIFWVIYHFLMLHTLLAFEFLAYQMQIMNGGTVIPFTEFYMNFLGKYFPIILTAAAILPILAKDLLKMSHRVVGPLIPFQRAVKQLKNGEHVGEIQIREGDLLVEFQKDFNEFLNWYNEQKIAHPENGDSVSRAIGDSEEKFLAEIETLQKEVTDHTGSRERSFIKKEG